MDMMIQRLVVVLLVVALVGLVRAEDAEEVVVASAEELKDIKAKKIIWQKDRAKMVRIPYKEKKYDRTGNLINSIFYMDATEVTVGQFKKFLKSTDHSYTGGLWERVYEYSPTDKYPMKLVSWFDAVAYAKWADKRRPAEAEWEFAARGGLVGKKYSWGDGAGYAYTYANSDMNGAPDKWEYCAPVGSFKLNGYGLYDMAGNVWEWCQDRWTYGIETHRLVKGGSWDDNPAIGLDESKVYRLEVAYRHIGFRCVADVP